MADGIVGYIAADHPPTDPVCSQKLIVDLKWGMPGCDTLWVSSRRAYILAAPMFVHGDG